MNRNDHLPALDGLRGLASILVILAHLPKIGVAASSPPLSGPLGVMLFFILSGFLMGHLYLEKPFDRAAASRYMAARIARVLPLYYLVVIGSFVLSLIFARDFSFYIDSTQFMRLMLISGHNYVFWSIPPEIQFYFAFVVIWAAFRTRLMTSWLPAILFIVMAVFLYRPIFPGISVIGQLQIFLTGVVVAVIRRRFVTRITPAAALTVQVVGLLAGGLTLLGVLPILNVIHDGGRFKDDYAYASLPLALIVGSVVLAYSIPTRFALAVFANRVAERLGAFSFGIYLLHWPIMHAVHGALSRFPFFAAEMAILGFAATIATAAAIHYGFERPVQTWLRPRLALLIDRWLPIGRRDGP